MAPSPLQQRRIHNVLLFQRLLNLRDGASPFTLVLDTLEQSGGPVIREFVRRAKISKTKVVFVSFATLQQKVPFETHAFVRAIKKSLEVIKDEILAQIQVASSDHGAIAPKYLIIVDTLNPVASSHGSHLSPFLTSILISPNISLIATYHTDIPLPAAVMPYTPSPLTMLTYLTTAILTISPLWQVLARKRARDRSLEEPVFGLEENKEGILTSKGVKDAKSTGIVVNMEIRRRSGRGLIEKFVLTPPSASQVVSEPILLDDHPAYATLPTGAGVALNEPDGFPQTTFELGLTEKQKSDREGVVLPYFDAQKDGGGSGPGEGGRILYQMGTEDREDFDDEEDEI